MIRSMPTTGCRRTAGFPSGTVDVVCAPRCAGFTLLELLLAMAISAVVAGVLYAALAIAFNVRDAVADELRSSGARRSALETMRADFAGAVRPTGILAEPMIGESGQDVHGRAADEVRFVTNNRMFPAAEPMGEVFAVRYALVDAPEAPEGSGQRGTVPPRRLVREVHTNLLAPIEEAPAEHVVARGVWSLEIRYHDGNAWREAWDSAAEGDALPVAVELTLHKLPESIDPQATRRELEQQAVAVRHAFMLPNAARGEVFQGQGQR